MSPKKPQQPYETRAKTTARKAKNINITKWAKKKKKKRKTQTTNYRITKAWPYEDHGQKETKRERQYGARAPEVARPKTPATTRQEKLYYKMGKKKAPTSAK